MKNHHTPVMSKEVVSALQVRPRGYYIDCNVGEGGHSLAILSGTVPAPCLLGIDLDSNALQIARNRLKSYNDNAVLVQGNFADVESIAKKHGFTQVAGVLFDLGLSSLQVDSVKRGFSFRKEARLDMRFDPSQKITAYDIVNEYSEGELADVIFRLGEDRKSRSVARSIVRKRPLQTTSQLADVVVRAMGKVSKQRIHPATRTFQAIRMVVNNELPNLERGLAQALKVLSPGGFLVVISYHSIEDRLVKNKLRDESKDCLCAPEMPACTCNHKATVKLLNRRIIRPERDEVNSNPRSRSARMRVAQRV